MKIDKIIANYNFDPLQVQLLDNDKKNAYVRITNYVDNGYHREFPVPCLNMEKLRQLRNEIESENFPYPPVSG